MESRTDRVLVRMLRVTDRTYSADDLASIRRGIDQVLDAGFTEDEAVRYCRNFEEYEPDLPEERALARMRAVQCDVERRLGRKVFK